jgi:hypothetical protein
VQIICHNHERSCGFRVDEWYFQTKKHIFASTQCPRCSSPLIIVEDYTVTPVVGAKMLHTGDDQGRIVRETN